RGAAQGFQPLTGGRHRSRLAAFRPQQIDSPQTRNRNENIDHPIHRTLKSAVRRRQGRQRNHVDGKASQEVNVKIGMPVPVRAQYAAHHHQCNEHHLAGDRRRSDHRRQDPQHGADQGADDHMHAFLTQAARQRHGHDVDRHHRPVRIGEIEPERDAQRQNSSHVKLQRKQAGT
ncbi:hypothetical protein RF55_25943, partial [Lasius niger]